MSEKLNSIITLSWARITLTRKRALSLFLRAAVPYTTLDYYRRYFDTCRRVNPQKDPETLFLFRLYFTLASYLVALNGAFALLPLSSETRVVLMDAIHIVRVSPQTYLFYATFIAYTIVLYWTLYHRVDVVFTAIFERIILGSPRQTRTTDKYVFFEGTFTREKLDLWAVRFTNSLQVFTLLFDVFVALCLANFVYAFCGCSFLTESALNFALCAPLFAFHMLIFTCVWLSLVSQIIFFGTYSMTILAYAITSCWKNSSSLRRACFNISPNQERPLRAALEENIHIFELIFLINQFGSVPFLLYLAVQMPFAAYYSMQLIRGKVFGLLYYVTVLFISETLLGTLVLHLAVGYTSKVAHKGGRILHSFTAKNSLNGKTLPVKLKINLQAHTQRLHVSKKYGFTYGNLGTLVTIESFAKSLIIYSELLMFSYNLK